MTFDIKQVVGKDDESPEKEALITEENITAALEAFYPGEKFIVEWVICE